ncbi:MAG: LPS assembly lipoprotein LptE [Thermodesulfobacteriota bacterium]
MGNEASLLRSRPEAAGAVRPSARVRILGALLALACLALAACAGYSPQGRGGLVLPEGRRDLCIVEVENPTLRPDLSALLRNLLRDELARRGQVRWTDREHATALVHLAVEDFTSQTLLTGSHEQTLKSSASITVEAWIERRPEGDQIWRSGRVGVSRSFTGNDRADAEARVLEQAAQRLADLLAQSY